MGRWATRAGRGPRMQAKMVPRVAPACVHAWPPQEETSAAEEPDKGAPVVYYEIFMTNVLRLLDEKQITKQALAKKAGMSISFLSDLTNGKANPSLKIMASIADALDVALPSLLVATDAVPVVHEEAGAYRVKRRLPAGFALVSAVLTDYQAFSVRQWDEANRKLIARSAAPQT